MKIIPRVVFGMTLCVSLLAVSSARAQLYDGIGSNPAANIEGSAVFSGRYDPLDLFVATGLRFQVTQATTLNAIYFVYSTNVAPQLGNLQLSVFNADANGTAFENFGALRVGNYAFQTGLGFSNVSLLGLNALEMPIYYGRLTFSPFVLGAGDYLLSLLNDASGFDGTGDFPNFQTVFSTVRPFDENLVGGVSFGDPAIPALPATGLDSVGQFAGRLEGVPVPFTAVPEPPYKAIVVGGALALIVYVSRKKEWNALVLPRVSGKRVFGKYALVRSS